MKVGRLVRLIRLVVCLSFVAWVLMSLHTFVWRSMAVSRSAPALVGRPVAAAKANVEELHNDEMEWEARKSHGTHRHALAIHALHA